MSTARAPSGSGTGGRELPTDCAALANTGGGAAAFACVLGGYFTQTNTGPFQYGTYLDSVR